VSRAVVDASALVRLVLRGEGAAELAEFLAAKAVVMAPYLVCGETANTLWKYVRAGQLDREEAVARLEQALALVDELVEDSELAAEALVAAVSAGHPVYDLLYAVLARRHGCPVITTDRPLVRLLQAMGVAVEIPGDRA
jgi:predicted nucleic acid-binding protein